MNHRRSIAAANVLLLILSVGLVAASGAPVIAQQSQPPGPVRAAAAGHTVWYLAEGYTGPGFDEYLTIFNPNPLAAAVTITYYLASGPPSSVALTVAARSRATVAVHETGQGVGRHQEVAARIESTNGVGLVVERPLYFAYGGSMGLVTGGHIVLAAPAPAPRWLFAEGYTGPGFDEYLTILNPHPVAAPVTITYYLATGQTKTVTLTVAATSRRSVVVHEPLEGVGRDQAVAAQVETTLADGIVVERPVYFRYRPAGETTGEGITDGHVAMGATAPQPRWYFAEGYTGPGFDQYLTVLNPAATPVTVQFTYYQAQGAPLQRRMTVAATSRATVAVHESQWGVGRGQEVATLVEALDGGAIVVERPIYFRYRSAPGAALIDGGHSAMGSSAPANDWYLAEGFTGAGFDQFLTLLNPTREVAPVTITYFAAGGVTAEHALTVPAQSRRTVAVHGPAPGVGRGQTIAARVQTSNPGGGIVVERPMYFRYGDDLRGGHTTPGLPRADYFATLLPGSALPSDAECAARVRRHPWEPDFLANTIPNQRRPTADELALYRAAEPNVDHNSYRGRVTGDVSGTTDELIQWAACKWGFDEELNRAIADEESTWNQNLGGDPVTDPALCTPYGDPTPCNSSYGIQMIKRHDQLGTYPISRLSTAFNLDHVGAVRRACYEGRIAWLAELYPSYQPGDLWGCVGFWYSGDWYDAGARAYIERIKTALANRAWVAWGHPGLP